MTTICKMICMLVFLGIATQSQAQTKEETVKWLTEKMMKDHFFEMSYFTGVTPAKIYKVRLDDNYLVIDGEYIWDYKDNGRNYRQKEIFNYEIDLAKLSDEVYLYGSYIATKGNFIKESSDWKKYRWQNGEYILIDSKLSKEYKHYMQQVRINDKVESEILERVAKALKHYQSLMTIKKSNETF